MTEPAKAEKTVNIVNPETGEAGAVGKKALVRAAMTGDRPMTDAEVAAFKERRAHEKSITEPYIANQIGKARGLGESVGIPFDAAARGIGGEETRAYLEGLKKYHPLASLEGDIGGQGAGFAAQAEIGGGAASVGLGRKILTGAARGGLESLVAGTTSDINEAALGDHDINGEKLLARAPEHILWGAGAGAAFGGLGHVLESGASAGAKAAGPALDRRASALIGRELGASGEEGAALGARVRGEMGGVPKSAKDIASFYGAKQTEARAAGEATHAFDQAFMGEQHTTEGVVLGERQAAGRAKDAAFVQDAIDNVRARHEGGVSRLVAERDQAAARAAEIGKRLEEHAEQTKNLASKLDAVEGAELPQTSAVLQASHDAVGKSGVFGENAFANTARTQTALKQVDRWVAGFQSAAPEGSLSFSKMEKAAQSLDQLAASARDPVGKQIFADMADAARGEFNRASAATAPMSSEGNALHAERLAKLGDDLKASQTHAAGEVTKHDALLSDATKQAAQDIKEAERLGGIARGDFEKQAVLEAKGLGATQATEREGLKKPQAETPYDSVKTAADAAAARGGEAPLVSAHAAMGALFALSHGNVGAAAAAVGGSLIAGQLRAASNLTGARVLSAIAGHLAGVDESLQRGALRALKTGTRETALSVSRAEVPETAPKLSFERVANQVKQNQANPQIMELRIRNQYGAIAEVAPQTYGSILASAQRAQDFLASIIPPTRTDPFSLTPHLDSNDVSEAEKYDFTEAARAIANPIKTLAGAKSGALTDKQVETIKAVYPGLYNQMKLEVQRGLTDMQKPLDHERTMHVGVLLQMPTTILMDAGFQKAQADMFAERVKKEEIKPGGGSAPRGPNAKMSKASMSGSERVESGEGY